MKNNKGVTLVSLTITIIVLIIIAVIGTYSGSQALKESKEKIQLSEVGMVQQAVMENYTKYKMTGNKAYLIGTKIEDFDEVEEIVEEINEKSSQEAIELKIPSESHSPIEILGYDEFFYYELNTTDLQKIGINEEDNVFIVNYGSGEVINKTLKVTRSGMPLYVYGIQPENLPLP